MQPHEPDKLPNQFRNAKASNQAAAPAVVDPVPSILEKMKILASERSLGNLEKTNNAWQDR